MGQPVTVIEKPPNERGIIRFELNRSITGMGHRNYESTQKIDGEHAADELARRIFARGGVDRIHINSNIVVVDLQKGASSEGLLELMQELFKFNK